MKKTSTSMLCTLLIAVTVFQGCKNNCSHNADSKITFKTLNNVDAVTAGVMIEHFKDLEKDDKRPLPESVWLSKEVIHEMVTLLCAERDAQIKQLKSDKVKGITDGIRIYFGCDSSFHQPPLHNIILLVSTKDNGPSVTACRSKKRHLDYYDHCASAPLFKLGSYGEICNEGIKCAGDSLYIKTGRITDKSCIVSLPHRIRRDSAEMMVQGCKDHPFNTYSEWFDLSFWKTIDEDKTHSGIRIYFATHLLVKTDITNSLRDALIITTTKYDQKTGTNIDYFNCDTYDQYIKNYQKQYPKVADANFLPTQDNGELCPFNCN